MTLPPWLSPAPEGAWIQVWAQPRASRTRVAGVHGEALKIQLAAPPVEGEANGELLKFLGKQLGVPRGDVEIARGESGRSKRVLVRGLAPEEIKKRLA